MANIVRALGWGRENYEAFVLEMKAFLEEPDSQRIYARLLNTVQRTPYLDQAGIKRALGIEHKPRVERRDFGTRWLQTKSVRRDDAGARALARVQELAHREQDIRAARY